MSDTLTAVPDASANGADPGPYSEELVPVSALVRVCVIAAAAGIGCLLVGAVMARLLDSTGEDVEGQGNGDGAGNGSAA